MNSKKITIALAAASMLLMSGCDDYFDDVPNNATSLEDIFANRGQTLGWLTNLYSIIPDPTSREAGGTAMYWNPSTIEGYLPWDWVETHDIISGTMTTSSSFVQRVWNNCYKGIMNANIYLANVDACKPMSSADKATTKAEARAMRAYLYLYLVKLYGPVCLVGDRVANNSDEISLWQLPRSSVDECFDYIIKEFKEVIDGGHLLSSYDGQGAYDNQHKGNFTKEAVQGFLADAYLFRASYIFNGDPFYASVANADGKKLFPQARDVQKWRDARDAAKVIIENPRYKLVLRDIYDRATTSYSNACPYKSVFFASMASSSNEEMIYGRPNSANDCYVLVPRFGNLPNSYDKGSGGLSVPLEFVDLYFTNKGLKIEDDPDYFTYDTDNPSTASRGPQCITRTDAYNDPLSGYNYFTVAPSTSSGYYVNPTGILKQFYNREARFYLAITFQNRPWEFQGGIPVQMQMNGNSGPNGSTHDFPIFGAICRKNYYQKQSDWDMGMVLRLAEIYLDYAEACAELDELDEAIEYVNRIRNRAGIAEYSLNGPGTDRRGLEKVLLMRDKNTVLKAIYRERLLELAYENKHYFDVRRWGVAEGKWRTDGPEMTDGWIYPPYHTGGEGGDLTGFNINNVGFTQENQYVNFYKRITQQHRIFIKRMSLFPVPHQEIIRNKQCVQNAGW